MSIAIRIDAKGQSVFLIYFFLLFLFRPSVCLLLFWICLTASIAAFVSQSVYLVLKVSLCPPVPVPLLFLSSSFSFSSYSFFSLFFSFVFWRKIASAWPLETGGHRRTDLVCMAYIVCTHMKSCEALVLSAQTQYNLYIPIINDKKLDQNAGNSRSLSLSLSFSLSLSLLYIARKCSYNSFWSRSIYVAPSPDHMYEHACTYLYIHLNARTSF